MVHNENFVTIFDITHMKSQHKIIYFLKFHNDDFYSSLKY